MQDSKTLMPVSARFVMPKIFAKILCPVAFDRNSGEAIKFAYELAEPKHYTLSSPCNFCPND